MKKVIFVSIMLMLLGCTSYVKQPTNGLNTQMGGRMSPDSPTDFNIGINKIHFFSEGTKVVGNLNIPKNYKKGQKLPAIVVIGPKGAVKEQTQGIYANKLSDNGFITLVIDHRTYGESGGEPRHYENPYMKIEDGKTSVSYIASLDVVDKNRIGLLGVCNGGGFGLAVATYDQRVKAYASIAGLFDLRTQIINGKPGDKKRLAGIMKQSVEARQKYFETGEVVYMQQMPDVDENSNQLRKEAYEYYRTGRGLVPNWGENKMAVFSRDTRRSFDITDQIELLSPRPYLAIAGTKALTFGLSQIAYDRANEPKEFFKIEGATHVDLYDIDKYVDQAVDKLNMFYTKSLN
jgi:hypothetical protein